MATMATTSAQPSAWIEGTVIEPTPGAAPHFYNIMPDRGQRLNGVPRLLTNPGDHDVLPHGTRVLVLNNAPRGPLIYGVIPGFEQSVNFDVSETGPELLPGDRVVKSPDGNLVGALAGGMSVMSSGGMAQVRTYETGHVDLLSETFTHHTSGSESKLTRDTDGKTNYALRIGANADEHAGPGTKDAWILRIDAGAKGDVLRIAVTTPGKKELSHIHMTAAGRIEVLALDGIHTQVQSQATQMIVGTNVRQVEGQEVVAVTGPRKEEYGSLTHTVNGAETSSAAARTASVSGNDRLSVSGDRMIEVGGDALHTVFGETQNVYGPATDPRTALAGMSSNAAWINEMGGFNFVLPSLPGNSFSVVSSLPGSVHLGVTGTAIKIPGTDKYEVVPMPGIYSSVLYETLQIWLNELLLWLDTHTHGTAVGPSTPPVVPSSPQLSPNTVTFQSQRVKIGL